VDTECSLICPLDPRDGKWVILTTRLRGAEQQIPSLRALDTWGYDDVPGAPPAI
jgi:hypothetical protein